MAPNISFSDAVLPNSTLLAAGTLIVLLVVTLTRHFFLRRSRPAATPPQLPHLLQFPPSRRHTLARFSQFEKHRGPSEIHPEILKSRALTTTRDHDFQDNLYTPTGFSTQELGALGRFPDYSVLSGVPHPEPVSSSWDVSRAIFRPFRPFRWNYHQHMALMKYDPNWWVELTSSYVPTMAKRQTLLAQQKDRIFFQSASPGTELAVRELMEMLLQFLCIRYPAHFSLSSDRTVFHNGLLNTVTDLLTTPPLKVIFGNVPEDYAIMLRNEETGYYHLRSAMVCSSVGWHVALHQDAPLRAIHTDVPDADKMAMSMDRWFAKLATDAPVMRCSWSLEDWEAMFTSPEAERAEGREWHRSAFTNEPERLTYKDIRLRCDAQTLRRLPLSGAVVFNFKAVFTPFEELRDEPYIPALLLKVLEGGKENLITYKCDANVRRVAMEALKVWADEQVRNGVVPADWEVTTLDESPFYPGWEERWKRKQGLS
ncbi:hypothetical protein QBC44DRAFT_262383 [Cladorrhinum sp. PSN332]|nr:hypothetical protein QBC44DRAFT_262383 [Cladorrhinum sp. PSN332]